MAISEPTTNHATREFTWRTRALTRELARADDLLQRSPSPILIQVRAQLAAAVQRGERGEVGAGEADALATMARLAIEALAGGR